MKKIFLVASFLIVSVCSFAQKSYINVIAKTKMTPVSHDIYLSGDIPTDMKDTYYGEKVGEILNQLSGKGYTVEFVSCFNKTSSTSNNVTDGWVTYLLSKSSGAPSAVRSVTLDNDEEVTEIARYNLQGIPVKESDKGVQIIVYSNYTTKTVIIQ